MTARPQPTITAAPLGALLQGARKSSKLTQAQLDSRLSLSQARLSELELAAGTLSVDQLLATFSQLGLQLRVQVCGDIPPAPVAATDW